MTPDRRRFIATLGVGAVAAAAGTPLRAAAPPARPAPISAKWDMSWMDRLKGKHRAVFDSPELSDGAAVFRAAMYRDQLAEVYGIEASEVTPVVVIRHSAIALAMKSAYWARFEIGKEEKMKDAKKKWVVANPVEAAAPGATKPWSEYNLTSFMASGGIVLACNLAFNQVVYKFRTEDKKVKRTQAEAREMALEYLIPGIILQPSGFFAVLRAQDEGCSFIVGS
jgi:hypothetical protein